MLSALPALMLATASPAAGALTPDTYPAQAVLEAFAEACGSVGQPQGLARLEAAGWERLPNDADTPVSKLARFGAGAMPQMAQVLGRPAPDILPGAEFRRAVAARTLYLAHSGVTFDGKTVHSCRLYDMDATRALEAGELLAWSGRPASAEQTLRGGVNLVTYSPGLKPEHGEMEVYFLPKGIKGVPGVALSGIAIVTTRTIQ